MQLIPSMSIKNGLSQRVLSSGSTVETDNQDPVQQAQYFKEVGFTSLYLVDRNGRKGDYEANHAIIREIIETIDLKIMVGGGIRSMEMIDMWFERGVDAVTLGSLALTEPELVKAAASKYPKGVILGISMQDNRVVSRSENRISNVKPLDLALQFDNAGLHAIMLTDVNRDGALMGANIDVTADMAMALTTPVIASGGVSCLADLQDLKDIERLGILGVLCGRALYDGKVDPVEGLKIVRGDAQSPKLPTDSLS